ncbi:MAG: HAMP domain-containing sensor histidine kinase [Balneolaceae bacterium]
MRIHAKLAWSYNILLIIGVITISSYAILSIRSFLLKEGVTQFQNDAYSIQLAVSNFSGDDTFFEKVKAEAAFSGYELAVYNEDGFLMAIFPDTLIYEASALLDTETRTQIRNSAHIPLLVSDKNSEKLVAYVNLPGTENPARYIRISQFKKKYYAAIASIRHIIYMGMAFSIGAVLIFSFIFARYMAYPILQLNEAALDIAAGNLDREINVNRKDEFGTLATSLNKMASKLKSDNIKLKTLNEKQNQFFADITHEVRNPLHAISGALEMMDLQNLNPDKKKQYMIVAQRQILRVVRLFEDIKSLQRYDFDESFISKKVFNLARVIEENFGVNEPFAQQKNINLGMEQTGSSIVYADPDKIEQVLDNLITNAIKYTNKGYIRVACVEEEDGVVVSVTDSGIGISDEHLNRLFDRFYRTDKARSRDKGGTGLGLAVVKSILSAHNTTIDVTSVQGKGTTFSFKLDKPESA